MYGTRPSSLQATRKFKFFLKKIEGHHVGAPDTPVLDFW